MVRRPLGPASEDAVGPVHREAAADFHLAPRWQVPRLCRAREQGASQKCVALPCVFWGGAIWVESAVGEEKRLLKAVPKQVCEVPLSEGPLGHVWLILPRSSKPAGHQAGAVGPAALGVGGCNTHCENSLTG